MKILFIVGLLVLAICWGKMCMIGGRMLLPFKWQDLKEKGLTYIVLALTLCTCGFLCMTITVFGAIILACTILM